MAYTTIWTRNTANFCVTLAWDYEDDGDLSWDDTGEALAKLESGEWTNHVFRVQVVEKATGAVLGEDYLGDSIYANAEEFQTERFASARQRRETGQNCGSYFPDMVASAIAEARKVYATSRPFLRAA